MDDYLNTAETARYLRLGERKLYELVAQGSLPPGLVIRLGRSVRLSRARLLVWLGAEEERL